MLTTPTTRRAITPARPAASRHSGTRRTPASLVRLITKGVIAGAVVALILRTGWPMPYETTLVLGIAFILWLVANFAAEPAP